MSNNILITVAGDTCGNLKNIIEKNKERVLHLPLENYQAGYNKDESATVISELDVFSFVIFGNLRNATHFIHWVKKHDLLKIVQKLVHFSLDKPTFIFLEQNGIPSIKPRENAQPIDILEFMLRISREGKTLYPTAEGKAEEMPGLLNELQMDVTEFSVCSEESLDSDTLIEYKQTLNKQNPDTVLFHNRSSLTRTNAAFPELKLQKMTILSGSAGVTNSLIDMGIEPDYEAEGTWLSIQKLIEEI